jgi:hypothetical protein
MDSLTVKFFTLEEANELVPEIRRIFMEINYEKHELAKKLIEAGEIKKRVMTNGNRQELKEKIEQILVLQESLTEIHKSLLSKGLIIRDLDQGVVDFPTIIDGDLGYFCWKLGETSIGYWHPVGEGSRQAITEEIQLLHTHEDKEQGKVNRTLKD